jgi:predicted ester cyclase
MANSQNEAIVRRLADMLGQPQLPPDYDQIFEPDWDNHAPGVFRARGPQGKALHASTHEVFSDYHVIVERLVSDGDHVAVHFRMRGTHTGEFMGIPATGRTIDVHGITIHRFRDGKLGESWALPDRMEMLQQLGVKQLPEMPQQRAA